MKAVEIFVRHDAELDAFGYFQRIFEHNPDAARRFLEERERGRDVTIEQINAELAERDRRDRQRAATPLVKAPDAILIDTSSMPLDRVIERVLEIIQAHS